MATTDKKDKYIEGIGRRKSAVARVRITPASKNTFQINEKPIAEYFPTKELQKIAEEALTNIELKDTFKVTAKIKGGGIHAQAESVRLGLARALEKHDGELRKVLKPKGFLKRDPRVVERKKPGLKKARKAAQWSKR
jgi:small subunit ribosomal protein S9